MELELPRLAGGREAVDGLTATWPPDMSGREVTVRCENLLASTPSYADQLLFCGVVKRGATRMVFVGANEQFATFVQQSAECHDVTDRIDFLPKGDHT